MLAIHARTEPYRDIWDRFSAVIDDYDDCEVLLDAHHVATAIDGTVLYTGDYRKIRHPDLRNAWRHEAYDFTIRLRRTSMPLFYRSATFTGN